MLVNLSDARLAAGTGHASAPATSRSAGSRLRPGTKQLLYDREISAYVRHVDSCGRPRRHDGNVSTLVHHVRKRCWAGPASPVRLVACVLVDLGARLLVSAHRGRAVP